MSAGEGTGGDGSNAVHPTKITLPTANASIAIPSHSDPERRGPPTIARAKQTVIGRTRTRFVNHRSQRRL